MTRAYKKKTLGLKKENAAPHVVVTRANELGEVVPPVDGHNGGARDVVGLVQRDCEPAGRYGEIWGDMGPRAARLRARALKTPTSGREDGRTVLCSVLRAPREYDGEEGSGCSGKQRSAGWGTRIRVPLLGPEIWGEMVRYGEIWGEMSASRIASPTSSPSSANRLEIEDGKKEIE